MNYAPYLFIEKLNKIIGRENEKSIFGLVISIQEGVALIYTNSGTLKKEHTMFINKNKKLLLFFSLLSILVFSNGSSVVYKYMSLEDQIRTAEYIVHGKLKSKKTGEYLHNFKGYTLESNKQVEFDVSRTSISTFFKFEVSETLMGKINQEYIEVMVVGGCFKGRCEDYSHSYDYKIGEEAVLLLNKGSDGIYFALNSSFDVFSIDENKNLDRKTDSISFPPEWKVLNKALTENNLDINFLKNEIKEVLNEK